MTFENGERFKMKVMQYSDLDLIEKFKKSDDQLYIAELYKRYSKHIMTICMSYLQEEGLHQDVATEVYLKITQDLPNKTFENSQRFKNWLAVIVKNHCITKLREIKSQSKLISRAKNINELNNYVEISGEIRYNSVPPEELKKSLNSLTEKQKCCLELFFFEGYKITDDVLKKLSSENVPRLVLDNLKTIKDVNIRGSGYFFDRINSLINNDENGVYKSLVMKYVSISGKKSYKEISDHTGFPLKEVKSHLQTGKIKLKNILKK